MIEVFALFEICPETTTCARRNTPGAQHGHVKKCEVPADIDLPFVYRSQRRKRPAVAHYDAIQNLLDRANMRLSLLVASERQPVGRCDVLMDQ